MFVHTVIMVIEPHMKQGRQHKLISTIFLATSVTKKLDHNIFTLCIKAFQLSSSIRQELDLSLMYSIISPIKKDINVPIETNKLSLSPNDSMKIENVNVKLLYM